MWLIPDLIDVHFHNIALCFFEKEITCFSNNNEEKLLCKKPVNVFLTLCLFSFLFCCYFCFILFLIYVLLILISIYYCYICYSKSWVTVLTCIIVLISVLIFKCKKTALTIRQVNLIIDIVHGPSQKIYKCIKTRNYSNR